MCPFFAFGAGSNKKKGCQVNANSYNSHEFYHRFSGHCCCTYSRCSIVTKTSTENTKWRNHVSVSLPVGEDGYEDLKDKQPCIYIFYGMLLKGGTFTSDADVLQTFRKNSSSLLIRMIPICWLWQPTQCQAVDPHLFLRILVFTLKQQTSLGWLCWFNPRLGRKIRHSRRNEEQAGPRHMLSLWTFRVLENMLHSAHVN